MNKPKIVRLTFALASLFAVTLASAQSMQSAVDAPQAPPQLRYIVIDLGARVANAISESGRIVGTTLFGGEIHAAYWDNSQSPPIDLGTLPGFTSSFAADINPRSEIVGAAGSFPTFRPLFWASSRSAPVDSPVYRLGFLVRQVTSIHAGRLSACSIARTFQCSGRCFGRTATQRPFTFPS